MNKRYNIKNPTVFKETLYFSGCVIASIMMYCAAIISLIGILYLIILFLVFFTIQGLYIGYLKGNGVKVAQNQFPEVYQCAHTISKLMELASMPDIYVVQSGGLLNAFVTRFFTKNFVVIYSDMLELAYAESSDALSFVICHEFAHIQRNHLKWHWLTFPASFTPFLYNAYSRAREYTCDQIGAHYCPKGAVPGLLVLASGKKLYRNVDANAFMTQSDQGSEFWVWFSEVLSTHPNLCKRVKAVSPAQFRT